MPTDPAHVEPPKHPLHALTTFELREFRRKLSAPSRSLNARTPSPQYGVTCKPGLMTCGLSRTTGRSWPPVRDHDVRGLPAGELERADRELRASLALARPDSPARVPILARLGAIDTELAARTSRRDAGTPSRAPGVLLCSCGFGTDDREWLDGHLFQHPGHHQRSDSPLLP